MTFFLPGLLIVVITFIHVEASDPQNNNVIEPPYDDTIGKFIPTDLFKTYTKFNHEDYKQLNLSSWQREEARYKKIEKRLEMAINLAEDLMSLDDSPAKYCPKSSCKCLDKQIFSDLETWLPTSITTEMIEQAKKIPRVTIYSVRSETDSRQVTTKTLYRTKNCYFPSRCEGIEHFIKKVLKDLPDMDFVVNFKDWPMSHKRSAPLPVFSFSKSRNDAYDIMYPAWTFWAGGPAISTGFGIIFQKFSDVF